MSVRHNLDRGEGMHDRTRDVLRYEVHYWPTSLHGGSKMADFSANALDGKGTVVHVIAYGQ
jgi:hypothetical protein